MYLDLKGQVEDGNIFPCLLLLNLKQKLSAIVAHVDLKLWMSWTIDPLIEKTLKT